MNSNIKPRLSFLSQDFHPEENTTSWLMSQLAFALADDFEVTVVARQPTLHGTAKVARVPRRLTVRGVLISRVASTRFNKLTMLGRTVNTFTFVAAATVRLMTLPRADLIFAVSSPPILHWIAALVGLLRRTPVVLLIHDQYPELVVAVGKMKKHSFVYGLWQLLTGWAYRRAVRIVTLGRCMNAHVATYFGGSLPKKVTIIPSWDDGEVIKPMKREDNPLLDEWGLRGKFVVLYAGNFGMYHELATVVDAAEQLKDGSAHFVFLGDGAKRAWLREQIARRKLSNITIFPFRPKEEMPRVITACDAGLITLITEATGMCVPSKLYGILAAGKPVLCVMDPQAETALEITEAKCGAVIRPGDADGLTELLRKWADSPRLTDEMGANARRAFDEHYTLPIITQQYRELMLEALSKGDNVAKRP